MGKCLDSITRYQNLNFVKKVDIAPLCCQPSTCSFSWKLSLTEFSTTWQWQWPRETSVPNADSRPTFVPNGRFT